MVAIITVEASTEIAKVHNRMPAILAAPEEQAAWLDPGVELDVAHGLLRLLPAGQLAFRPVGARVNNTRNDDPVLLDEQLVEALPTPVRIRRRDEPDPNQLQNLQGEPF